MVFGDYGQGLCFEAVKGGSGRFNDGGRRCLQGGELQSHACGDYPKGSPTAKALIIKIHLLLLPN